MKVQLGCHLAYRVKNPTPFVFNVELARAASQRVLSETLILDPDLPVERWIMPETGNRYLRVQVPAGPFSLRYEADAELAPTLDAPEDVDEIPAGEIPLATLVHLTRVATASPTSSGGSPCGRSARSPKATGASMRSAIGSTTTSITSGGSPTS